jgi:hypothetical protein
MREALLFIHPTLGVLGILSALWVLVEALEINEVRLRRMRLASLIGGGLFLLTWFSGGIWDAFYYEDDRVIAQKGAWSFIGDTTMEFKEHYFVLVLMLALYLPVLTFATDVRKPEATRLPTLITAAFVVLAGLAMEGAGAILAGSVHVGMTTMLSPGG